MGLFSGSDDYTGVVYTFVMFGPQENSVVWQRFTAAGQLAPGSGTSILLNLSSIRTIFAGSSGVFYIVNNSGQLLWYRDLANDGTVNLDPNSGTVISDVDTDFSQYIWVAGGGDGVIYAADEIGNLLWFKDCANNGTPGWWAKNSGTIIRRGITSSEPLNAVPFYSGGDGVIYFPSTSGFNWNKDCLNDGSNACGLGQQPSGWDPQSGYVLNSFSPNEIIWGGNWGTYYGMIRAVI